MERIASALAGSSDQLDGKMVTLKRKLQVLENKQDDVKEQLKQVEYSLTKKPKTEVQGWLAEVERIKTEVQLKEQEVQERRPWWGNRELGRSVDKLTTEVEELTEQSKFPGGLTLESHERKGVPIPTGSLIGETFRKNQSEILDCLMGDEDSVIGIYGMGGVGKTTLLTHIHNELLEHKIAVSWVTVSQNFSIRNLQDKIANAIGLDISKEFDERRRAAQLAWAFQRRKNFILILDDVWENISLEKVGICVGENGRKLILTTRSLEVCRMINCEEKIKVQPLSNVEAWALFVKTLGNQTLLSGQIEGIAKSLVEECDGLPLGIIVMAGSMKGVEDIREWRHALEEIRDVKHDDMHQVFHVLEYSYRKLNGSPKVQECFLYCSLYPEDKWIRRDELIEHFIDEKLVDGMKSRKSQFDEGHVILNRLENICLLEGVGQHECVKMHDLVRDMAIRVTRVGPPRFLVQAGMKLEDIPNEEKWSEDLVRVSLMTNNIKSIPFYSSPPKCPTLLTLLLRGNHSLRVIPTLFFMHMKSLTVLDLSDTSIESLPSSISNLESLTALLLRNCAQLRLVPSLENLTALRRLVLEGSAIKEVPKGLEKLINLRYLSFEYCRDLLTIPDGILSKLSQIEYFMSSLRVTLRGKEIGSLVKLKTFFGTFEDISEFNSCIRLWEEWEPEEYRIVLGNWSDVGWTECTGIRRHVILNKAVCSEDTLVLPRGSERLELDECLGITSLSHIATVKQPTDLRDCEVISCHSLRHVICSCCDNVPLFQSLEILELEDLPMLTDVVERERSPSSAAASSMLPINTFSSLRKLEIRNCHGLKRLFTPTLLSNLQSLVSCEVKYCRQLVEIIGETSDEDENRESTTAVMTMPPGLQRLDLIDLPELKSFCNSSIKVSDSLEFIRILSCPRLMRITLLREEPHPSLPSIWVEKDWWDTVEWKHPQTKDVLQPYVQFTHAQFMRMVLK